MKYLLVSLLAVAITLYGLAVWIFYIIHVSLLFHPEKLPADFTFSFNRPFEEVTVEESDIHRIHGIHFKISKSSGVILYLHGNGGNVSQWGHLADDFLSRNYDFFVMDYRGYGKSFGQLTEETLLYDVQKCYEYLKTNYNDNIIVYGRSVGTGPAAYLASHNAVAKLILETPYYNIMHLARHYVPFLPYQYLLKFKLETASWIKQAQCPVAIVHGTADEVIPFNSSRQLKKEIERIQLHVIQGGKHNNLSTFLKYDQFLDIILNQKHGYKTMQSR